MFARIVFIVITAFLIWLLIESPSDPFLWILTILMGLGAIFSNNSDDSDWDVPDIDDFGDDD